MESSSSFYPGHGFGLQAQASPDISSTQIPGYSSETQAVPQINFEMSTVDTTAGSITQGVTQAIPDNQPFYGLKLLMESSSSSYPDNYIYGLQAPITPDTSSTQAPGYFSETQAALQNNFEMPTAGTTAFSSGYRPAIRMDLSRHCNTSTLGIPEGEVQTFQSEQTRNRSEDKIYSDGKSTILHQNGTHCDFRNDLVDASNLQRHMRSHAEPRGYGCQLPGCSTAFNRPDHLTAHIATHIENPAKRKRNTTWPLAEVLGYIEDEDVKKKVEYRYMTDMESEQKNLWSFGSY